MQHGTELERFRAQWQEEVAKQRPRHTRAAPAASSAASPAPPAPPPAAPPPAAPPADHAPTDEARSAPKGKARSAYADRLAALLDTLVPAHEAAAEAAARSAADAHDTGADAHDTGADAAAAPPSPTALATDLDALHVEADAAPTIPPPGAAPAPPPRPPQTVHALHPADVDAPLPAARLPDEVWMCVFQHALAPTPAPPPAPRVQEHTEYRAPPHPWRVWTGADYVTLEACARVCWKFRLLTAHPQLWRAVAHATYVPPQIPPSRSLAALRDARQQGWRDLFVYEPRVRQHGVYIAACTYTQQGLSEENVWVRVLHVVQFYRYLRFFPNGRCLSWLTTDAPRDTVHQLVPGMRAKGLAAGRWHLLTDASGGTGTVVVEDLHDPTVPHYRFQMTLHLVHAPGRWHRLELIEHASLHLRTGEVLPFPPQKHQRPFFFSRVRGYGV
ncbi:hypothetical protein MBRA1_003674 [Malassezia brasiliensis]|uniref:F-box protein Hrt3/FBXO9 C-terminal domain-containing protein n=1 Tax=Malassezia brasiliensis TaxID=1821822 RepID=A0AAF0IQ28_9BASI|nr:hypothetical protein MBRA1_003674 [Malassezia brasiliensis]